MVTEFASFQNVLWAVTLMMAGLLLLPVIVFICVKMGTAAFFYGRDAYRKSQKNEELADGDAKRQEEKEG